VTGRRPYILGLTGGIGSGKSTTAALFAEAGVPVWDADAAVHRLYTEDADLIAQIAALVPAALVAGRVDRGALKGAINADPAVLRKLEALVHPRVAEDRAEFVANQSAPLVVLDIPLLYETGPEASCDGVLVVTTSPAEQRRRVLERGLQSEADFKMLLAQQMPLAEKAARADFVIESKSLEQAREAVHDLIKQLTGDNGNHA